MRRLLIVVALAVVPALGLSGWLHWSEVQEAMQAEEQAHAKRAELETLRARAPEASAAIAYLETSYARYERSLNVLERLAGIRGKGYPALVSVRDNARLLGVTLDSAWAGGGFVEVAGRAPDRRAANMLGQTLEEHGHATDVDLWRMEPDGRFALLARLPKAPAR
jgi:hypothetical protein